MLALFRLFWENKDIILEFEDSSEVLQFIHDSRNKQIEHSPGMRLNKVKYCKPKFITTFIC